MNRYTDSHDNNTQKTNSTLTNAVSHVTGLTDSHIVRRVRTNWCRLVRVKTWIILALQATWFEISRCTEWRDVSFSDLSGFNNHETDPEGMSQGREQAPHLTSYTIYTAPDPHPSLYSLINQKKKDVSCFASSIRARSPLVCCAGFVSTVSSHYPAVLRDTFNISAASYSITGTYVSSEALGFPQRVRCCISSSTLTLLRVDGDGGWAIKVMKWPLLCPFRSHVSTLSLFCSRLAEATFCLFSLHLLSCVFPHS